MAGRFPSDLPDPDGLAPRLRYRLYGARLAVFWERLWPGLWPATAILLLFIAVALFDLLPRLPGWLHLVGLALFALSFTTALGHALRHLRLANLADARRYLEGGDSGASRPLSALDDRLATDYGPTTRTLWAAHRVRMAVLASRLRLRPPAAGLARVDPLALRVALVLILVIAIAGAGPDAANRMARAVTPVVGEPATPATFEAWISPPAYTGLAPLFLRRTTDVETAIDVPENSVLTVQWRGGRGQPLLITPNEETAIKAVEAGLYRSAIALVTDGPLRLRQGGTELASWRIRLIADQPPSAWLTAAPRPTESAVLRLDYAAGDDYGIDALRAHIRLTPNGEGGTTSVEPPLALELNAGGEGGRAVSETSYSDLSAHPWAGLEVEITLEAQDAAGQTGTSIPVIAILPERYFLHPMARALIEQRKILTRNPAQRSDVAAKIWRLAGLLRLYDGDVVVYLVLRTAATRLLIDPRDTARREVRDLLWETALRLEEGDAALALHDLRQLQNALREALDRNAPQEELERLVEDIRRALDRYLDALARAPQSERATLPPNAQEGNPVRREDLQQLLNRMSEMMRSGARASARQMLQQLSNILENLRTAPPRRLSTRSEQLLRQFDDLAARQERLLDQTFRQSQDGQSQDGQSQDRQPSSDDLQAAQEALRQALGESMQRLGDQSGAIPDALGQAEQAMRDAERALGNDRPGDAVRSQSRALEQLRNGIGQAQRSLSGQNAGEDGLSGEDRGGNRQQEEAPLGRDRDIRGGRAVGDVPIPDEGDMARSRRIIDELRRRAGDAWRPPLERQYIDRLLERF